MRKPKNLLPMAAIAVVVVIGYEKYKAGALTPGTAKPRVRIGV